MPVTAQWQVSREVDSMTDKKIVIANVKNDSGYTLSIYRDDKSGNVFANFKLPEGSLEQISPDKALIYRIDKHEALDLQYLKGLQAIIGGNSYEWQPKWVNFLFATSDSKDRSIIQLFQGSNLLVRYYLPSGGYEETSFSLAGARDAITEAVGPDVIKKADASINDTNGDKSIDDVQTTETQSQ
jgi:hypothetical protein